MIVLNCPRCAGDIPEPDLSQIIRFYDGDMGITRECPDCGAKVWWKMTLTVDKDRSWSIS